MAAQLVIDIGNSRVKAGLVEEGALQESFLVASPEELTQWQGYQVIFIDTRGDKHWRAVLAALEAEELTRARPLPFPTLYSQELGADRAAQLIAAWAAQRFPAAVVSLGTAFVLDYLDEQGTHVGGIISPGAHLRLRALAENTGRLPRLSLTPVEAHLGRDTASALRAGALHGLGFELQGWLSLLPAHTTLWVCGGEYALLARYLPSNAIFAPDLTLKGVWLWWHYLHDGSASGG
ncbi:MAG: type III pantothenate kinase [Bacteroidia bacterium]|jgi:type III pantothenate kinase|nr:type III pantothenate kinase [Bacteroidia bacterium]GIV24221.1 MAG: type III pantothenate kinase [Bacteroidia bacterium]